MDIVFEGKIDIATFKKGKARYSQKILDVTFELEEIKQIGVNSITHITKCLSVFKNLEIFYNSGSWETKQMILGSMFSKKMIFEKNACRILKLNAALHHIFQVSKDLGGAKKRTSSQKFELVLLIDLKDF